MEENTTNPATTLVSTPVYTATPPGILSTKLPSGITLVVAVLLFLMPFAEIKCKGAASALSGNSSGSGMTVASNTGLGLALGMEWKSGLSKMGGMFNEGSDKTTDKRLKGDGMNLYALVALILGVVAVGFTFARIRSAGMIAAVASVLAAASLIGLMVDLHSQIDKPGLPGVDDVSGDASGIAIVLRFTPWIYATILAFFAGAFFNYKRSQAERTIVVNGQQMTVDSRTV